MDFAHVARSRPRPWTTRRRMQMSYVYLACASVWIKRAQRRAALLVKLVHCRPSKTFDAPISAKACHASQVAQKAEASAAGGERQCRARGRAAAGSAER